ncbi:MAG TPA: MFS transporter [Kofleriaceae bacterium]|nr:MFS transporter [Kofleriaceae bacterium]
MARGSFKLFWTGQTLSFIGDGLTALAMPLLVLRATGSIAQMGLVSALAGAGQLCAGLFAGQVADRVDRRRLMIRCELARGALLASVPAVFWLAGPQLLLLYAVACAGAALGMFSQVAYVTLVPRLVGTERMPDQERANRITEANGRLELSRQLAFVVGPVVAGVLCGLIGAETVLAIDAASFVVSAVTLACLRPDQAPAAAPAPARRWDGLLDGARFLVRDPVLRAATLVLGTFALLAAGSSNLLLYHLEHDLGQSDAAVGLIAGIASVGGILAAVAGPILRRRLGFGACFLGGTALHGAALGAVGAAGGLVGIAPAVMTSTFADVVKGLSSMSLRQQLTPDHLLGRVTAAYWLFTRVLVPVGAAGAAAAAQAIGARPVLVLIGVLGLLVAAAGAFTPARTRFPEAA